MKRYRYLGSRLPRRTVVPCMKVVTKEDFARVVGQSILLLSGEAEVVNGRIKKPLEAETWVDCCLLNDINLPPIWDKFVQRTAAGSLPEVRKFFRR